MTRKSSRSEREITLVQLYGESVTKTAAAKIIGVSRSSFYLKWLPELRLIDGKVSTRSIADLLTDREVRV